MAGLTHVHHRDRYNEGGDSLHYGKDPGGYWKLKKLSDGRRTPVFMDGTPKTKDKKMQWWQEETPAVDANANVVLPAKLGPTATRDQATITDTVTTSLVAQPLPRFDPDDIVKCPFCYDPVIEATVSTCGHVFCRECIEKWMKLRNWCPICQESLTNSFGQSTIHRVYAIDEIIERHLEDLGPETKQRFLENQGLRFAANLKEYNRKGYFKYLQKWTRSAQLYLQSKGKARGLGRLLVGFWKNHVAWIFGFNGASNPFGMGFMVTLMLGFILGVWSCDCTPMHFLKYLWDAAWAYPGPYPTLVRINTITNNTNTDHTQRFNAFDVFKWIWERLARLWR